MEQSRAGGLSSAMDDDAALMAMFDRQENDTNTDTDVDHPMTTERDVCASAAGQQDTNPMHADYVDSDVDTDDAWLDEDDEFESATATRLWSSQNASRAGGSRSSTEVKEQVLACHCQSIPSKIPHHYIPPCLPYGAVFATREIQMRAEFKQNLLCLADAHLKTQTMRAWGPPRRAEHYEAYIQRRWIRVWRGQGNVATIGWLLITHWDMVQLEEITRQDCRLEGRPTWTPRAFADTYFKGLPHDTQLVRIRFIFRTCVSIGS
jgi:hypothetical protein